MAIKRVDIRGEGKEGLEVRQDGRQGVIAVTRSSVREAGRSRAPARAVARSGRSRTGNVLRATGLGFGLGLAAAAGCGGNPGADQENGDRIESPDGGGTDAIDHPPVLDGGGDGGNPDTMPPGPPATPVIDGPMSYTVGPDTPSISVTGSVDPARTASIVAKEEGSGTEFDVENYKKGDATFRFPVPRGERCQFAAVDQDGMRSEWSDAVSVAVDETPPAAPTLGPGQDTITLPDIVTNSFTLDVTVDATTTQILIYKDDGMGGWTLFDTVPVTPNGGEQTIPVTVTADGAAGQTPDGHYKVEAQDAPADDGHVNETVDGPETMVEWPEPTLGAVSVDCSGWVDEGGTPGFCGAQEIYPFSFDATNGATFTATVINVNGVGANGALEFPAGNFAETVSGDLADILDPISGRPTMNFRTGTGGGGIRRIEVTVTNPLTSVSSASPDVILE